MSYTHTNWFGDLLNIEAIALLLPVLAIAMLLSKNILSSVIFQSAFSLVMTLCYLLLDAPDVALTEAAINACLATIIFVAVVLQLPRHDSRYTSKFQWVNLLIGLLIVVTGGIMWQSLPKVGDSYNFIHLHVAPYYLENTYRDIGIPSVVAAILASYRGFDTLGETTVIFTALLVVLSLAKTSLAPKKISAYHNNPSIFTTTISKWMIPIMIIASWYIYLHGEISPGGGFQAGAMLASLSLALRLALNYPNSYPTQKQLMKFAAAGVIIYAGTGLLSFASSENYLNYDSLVLHNPLLGQKLGIIVIELGVTFTVWAGLTAIAENFLVGTQSKLQN